MIEARKRDKEEKKKAREEDGTARKDGGNKGKKIKSKDDVKAKEKEEIHQ